MTQKVEVTIVSDLTDEVGAHTVDFGWAGNGYEIDLTEAERGEFETFVQRYIDAGRKVTSKRGRPRGATAKAASSVAAHAGTGLTKEQRQEVRAYAAQHGYTLAERGRLPSLAITAWQEQNPEILKPLAA